MIIKTKLEDGQKPHTSSQIPPCKRSETPHKWSETSNAKTVRIPKCENGQNPHTNGQKSHMHKQSKLL